MPFYVSTIAGIGFACLAVVVRINHHKINRAKRLSVIFGACAACFILYSVLTMLLIGGIT